MTNPNPLFQLQFVAEAEVMRAADKEEQDQDPHEE